MDLPLDYSVEPESRLTDKGNFLFWNCCSFVWHQKKNPDTIKFKGNQFEIVLKSLDLKWPVSVVYEKCMRRPGQRPQNQRPFKQQYGRQKLQAIKIPLRPFGVHTLLCRGRGRHH